MANAELKGIGKRLAALTVLLACLVVAAVGEFETKGQAQGGCCVGVCCSSCAERVQGCEDRCGEPPAGNPGGMDEWTACMSDCGGFGSYCNDVCNADC